jgi:hypothetical protein
LTVSGWTASNKPYDGTTAATVTGTPQLNGILGSDNVRLTGTPSFAFASPNVGRAVPVTASGLKLTGAQSGNYGVTAPGLSADITGAELTISGLTANDKEYDGTQTATVSGTAKLKGVFGSDDVKLTGTPQFTFFHAEVGNIVGVWVDGYTLGGAQGGNYVLTLPTLSARISPARLRVIPVEGQMKIKGEDEPLLLHVSEGWKLYHNEELLSGSLTREEGEGIGQYAILQGTLHVTNPNYVIEFVDGVLFEIKAGVGIDGVESSTLQVYPNPVKSGVPFTVAAAVSDAKIQIFDLRGVLVKQQQAVSAKTEIVISRPGVYIVKAGADRVKITVR